MEKYVIEMLYKGEWKAWGRTDDKARAEIMLKAASCHGKCRLTER